ncbi:LysR substrate-binding domain-containing protein [Dermabacteraceae bacterium P13128]
MAQKARPKKQQKQQRAQKQQKPQEQRAEKQERIHLRVGFVPGVEPDRFSRRWRELQRSRRPSERAVLEFVPIAASAQEQAVRELDMCLLRLPYDAPGVHCLKLWQERPVAVFSADSDLAAEEGDLPTADLSHGGVELAAQHPDDAEERVAVAASGVGYARMPLSLARLYARKDVRHRVLSEEEPTQIALVWRREVDSPACQDVVGIVRGRTPRSSR